MSRRKYLQVLRPVLWAAMVLGCILVVVTRGCVRLKSKTVRTIPAAGMATPTNLFDRTVAEGVRLFRPEGGAFPVIAFEACRIAKPRLGGFRLGIGNILELDGLEVNLPLDARATVTNTTATGLSVDQILQQVMDVTALRRLTNISTPLSGVHVHALRVCMVQGNERVLVLAAVSGRLAGKGLALKDCEFLDETHGHHKVSEARLCNENGWRVIAGDGTTVELEKVAVMLRRPLPQ